MSVYQGAKILLATKHGKSQAIAPAFSKTLGANVVEFYTDTDVLGTFSGEIERVGTPSDVAKKKCALALDGTVKLALASEGSFGPHPFMPFVPCNFEWLYFIDTIRGFELTLSYQSDKTNYAMQSVDSLEALNMFAEKALFPSHALILKPESQSSQVVFKGIKTQLELEKSFIQCQAQSSNNQVWVETDMRAHLNPSRMAVIERLAQNLSFQLSQLCPCCATPGWGQVGVNRGLPCSACDYETSIVRSTILGCAKCDYKEEKPREDGLTTISPGHCQYCNP